MNVAECTCPAGERVRGEETGPSRNPHNELPARQYWCATCGSVFSEPKSEPGPGLYWWVRDADETGMSGSGRVAQVAVFEDGSAALRWLKARNTAAVQSTVFYESVRDLVHVHGHGEKRTGHMERA